MQMFKRQDFETQDSSVSWSLAELFREGEVEIEHKIAPAHQLGIIVGLAALCWVPIFAVLAWMA